MAKKIKVSIVLLVLVLTQVTGLLFFVPNFMLRAQSQIIENSEFGIPDFFLYNELLYIANQGRLEPLLQLETDSLVGKENIEISNSSIESLQGLDLLDLSFVKSLNLKNNQISKIYQEEIAGLSGLEYLNLANNELNFIELEGLNNLNQLILTGNKISYLDLSYLKEDNILEYIDLSNNNFKSLNNLLLPISSEQGIEVYITNNYLTQEENLDNYLPHTFDLLFQGAKEGSILTEGSRLMLYSSLEGDNLTIKIYQGEDLLKEVESEGQIILPVGRLKLQYFREGLKLEEEVFYDINFTVRPLAPFVKIMQKGVQIETQSSYKNPITVQLFSPNSEAILQYSIDGRPWQSLNSFDINKNGRYRVEFRSVYSDIESEIFSVYFNYSNPSQAAVDIFKAIISALAIGVMFVVVYFYYLKTKKN